MWDLLGPYLAGSATSLAVVIVVGFAAKTALSKRISESIASEFRKEHERFAANLRQEHEVYAQKLQWASSRRAKASEVADVISSWIALSHDSDKTHNVAAYLEVQKKYWELCLWLDTMSLRLLNDAMTARPGADYKHALIQARKVITGDDKDPFEAHEIVHFKLPR
jgi:hypothetical protein